MRVFNADNVATSLPYDQLIEAIEDAFREGATVPQRSHYPVAVPNATSGSLLLMPAWASGEFLGVKIVTVFPDNELHGMAAVRATYVIMDANTGAPRGILDGTELTLRRTAAASALASKYLSRPDSRTLLMIGTGKLAPHMILAHATVRPISKLLLWGRRIDAAKALADEMRDAVADVAAVENLEEAVQRSDIISCATLAKEPLLHGEWLQAGQHVDLVGSFTPEMREADTEAVLRSELFVDTHAGATTEAGEIVQAIRAGKLAQTDIRADLAALVRGEHAGRSSAEAITLFKSVGTALEDLAAARLVLSNSA
ncbi:MAG TPA: ornithine cyclodeaminase family protein [Woeseiaceae bacterium]|nr:ornithine cyclodeaminase family protein [Woeseiaceae bacterium]